MIQSFELVPTDKPPSPPSVNDLEFLTYENSTYGIRIQYPSNWKPIDDVGLGNISFGLPDEESNPQGLFVGVVPLPYAVSESVFLDEYIPIWLSSMKDNLTNFSLIKSKAYALDDSPAQRLEYSYTDEWSPSLEQKALSIFAVENNILYQVGYQPTTTSYFDNIPIIWKMIESFEILEEKAIRSIEEF